MADLSLDHCPPSTPSVPPVSLAVVPPHLSYLSLVMSYVELISLLLNVMVYVSEFVGDCDCLVDLMMWILYYLYDCREEIGVVVHPACQ
jgi:hypothetical protein